ncbi:uncharacterized protein N7518_007798 [Penicillium psychrosexuale]|uniref:uncharacterized protein n=1 Tax=Penicillium psychrosexuale TaxID=1002107 RepID=UPI002544F969|nr:uncharacterized protein N7518_007798 [Penicillium psychrosexuale]KAJ5790787.1 hypothetical protein N7518_007798 [Penicillium psychrosexuale]
MARLPVTSTNYGLPGRTHQVTRHDLLEKTLGIPQYRQQNSHTRGSWELYDSDLAIQSADTLMQFPILDQGQISHFLLLTLCGSHSTRATGPMGRKRTLDETERIKLIRVKIKQYLV